MVWWNCTTQYGSHLWDSKDINPSIYSQLFSIPEVGWEGREREGERERLAWDKRAARHLNGHYMYIFILSIYLTLY